MQVEPPQQRTMPSPTSLMTRPDRYNWMTWMMIKDNIVTWTGICPAKWTFSRYAPFDMRSGEGESCSSIPMLFLTSATWLRRDEKVRESSYCITPFILFPQLTGVHFSTHFNRSSNGDHEDSFAELQNCCCFISGAAPFPLFKSCWPEVFMQQKKCNK